MQVFVLLLLLLLKLFGFGINRDPFIFIVNLLVNVFEDFLFLDSLGLFGGLLRLSFLLSQVLVHNLLRGGVSLGLASLICLLLYLLI